MSHIAKYGCKLTRVNKNLMKEAVKLVAKQLKGEVTTRVHEFQNYEQQDVDVGLKFKGMERGIGINYEPDGTPTFVGDPYQKQKLWDDTTNRITRTYTALAQAHVMRQRGYQVSFKDTGDEIKVICEA